MLVDLNGVWFLMVRLSLGCTTLIEFATVGLKSVPCIISVLSIVYNDLLTIDDLLAVNEFVLSQGRLWLLWLYNVSWHSVDGTTSEPYLISLFMVCRYKGFVSLSRAWFRPVVFIGTIMSRKVGIGGPIARQFALSTNVHLFLHLLLVREWAVAVALVASMASCMVGLSGSI